MILPKLLGGSFIIGMLNMLWGTINHTFSRFLFIACATLMSFQTVHKLELGEGVIAHTRHVQVLYEIYPSMCLAICEHTVCISIGQTQIDYVFDDT